MLRSFSALFCDDLSTIYPRYGRLQLRNDWNLPQQMLLLEMTMLAVRLIDHWKL